MKFAQLSKLISYKFHILITFHLYNTIFAFTPKIIINYEFNNKNLKSALIKIIEDYNLSIIFPEDVINTSISAKCYNCSEKNAFDSLLIKTKYNWSKTGTQYTIYKSNYRNEYSISGQIIDKETGEPIPYANVFISELKIGDISEYDGTFSISHINIPNCEIMISYIGYKTQNINLYFPKDNNDIKKVLLSPKVILSNKISIIGTNYEFMGKSETVGQIAFSPRFISSLPNLGEVDIFRSLQLLPGIQLGLGGTSELYIKGGEPSQNLILLDGMPIYQANHMYGFITGINSNAIKDIQIFSSDIPAEYGGKINSIIKLTGKRGNNQKPHGEFHSNFISSGFAVETPLFSKGSFILNQRKTNKSQYKSQLHKAIYNFTTGDNEFNLIEESSTDSKNQMSIYEPESSFSDIIYKISFLINPNHNISITNLYGVDSIKETRLFFGLESILGTDSTQIIKTIKKEDQGISANLFSNWSNIFKTHIIFSKNRLLNIYNTQQYLLNQQNKFINIGNVLINNEFEDISTKINFTYKGFKNSKTKLGFEQVNYNISNSENNNEGLTSNNSNFKKNTILNSFYIQNRLFFHNKSNIQIGLRIEHLEETKKFYKSPRISFNYNLNPNFSYETSIGKHYQFTHRLSKINPNIENEFYWITSSNTIPTLSSTNFYNGFNLNEKSFILKTSLYYKSLKNLFTNIYSEKIYSDSIYIGTGDIKGFEILLRKKNGSITGWVSYNLNKTIFNFPNLNNASSFLSDYDKTHEIKSVLITKLKSLDLSANWVLSSGRVYTDTQNMFISPGYKIITTNEKNEQRLFPIHHLDISVSKQWIIKNISIQSGLSVYNLYNKKNISHKRYNPYLNQLTMRDVSMFGITPTGFIKISF